jgi:hypothetical protein
MNFHHVCRRVEGPFQSLDLMFTSKLTGARNDPIGPTSAAAIGLSKLRAKAVTSRNHGGIFIKAASSVTGASREIRVAPDVRGGECALSGVDAGGSA